MVGFDLKEKIKELKRKGKKLPKEYFDLGVAFWLLNPDEEKYTGEYLCQKYLHPHTKRELAPSAPANNLNRDFAKNNNLNKNNTSQNNDSCYGVGVNKNFFESEEVLNELKKYAEVKLKEYNMEKLFYDLEMPLLQVLAEMELNGIGANKKKLLDLDKEIGKELNELTLKIYKESGEPFNINSPKQLSDILFNRLKINPPIGLSGQSGKLRKTSTGLISTDVETLSALKNEHKIIGLILEYRELFKLQSTYVKPFQELIASDKRIHTHYLQTGTVTGRLSSENPNMQNIPAFAKVSAGEPIEFNWAKEFRNCFESKKGYTFVAFDYSQIELRVLASLADDPKMIEAFDNDLDIHKMTAAQINNIPIEKVTPEMRSLAKTLNFGVVYGMGYLAFAKTSGLSNQEAKKFIVEYFHDFEEIKKWHEKIEGETRKNCYVSNLNGRRRWLLNIVSNSSFLAAQAEREAINMPVQSLAADILKMAMVKINEDLKRRGWLNEKIRLLLTIHDELLFEVKDDIIKEAKTIIPSLMESIYKLSVPIKVSVEAGKSWGKMESI